MVKLSNGRILEENRETFAAIAEMRQRFPGLFGDESED